MWAYLGLSALLVALLTPLTIFLARVSGVVTDPSHHKHPAHTHKGVLPRAGGLPLFFGIFVPMFYFALVNKIIFFTLMGAGLVLLVGLYDDKYDMSPYLRFFFNVLAASIAVLGGIGIPFVTNPFTGSIVQLSSWQFSFDLLGQSLQLLWVADIAAVLWIVWCMNMINWSKGVDGQLPGFVFIAALFLALLSQRFTRHDISKEAVTIMGFVTAGSFLGFLPWNFYPQKILPGYGAGSLAGYMLAVLSILSFAKFGTLILVIALPFTDAILVIIRRLLQKRSPFKGDRGHFHHALLDLGWGRRRIAVFYWLVSLIVGFFSYYMSPQTKLFAFALLFFTFAGMILWSFYFVKHLKNREEE